MSTPLTIEFRILFLAILIVIVPFGLLLYLLPSETSVYWAWEVAHPRSSILIGAGYTGAIFYYVLALRQNSWLQIRNGLGGLLIFSLVLLFATAVHWRQFKAYHPTTIVWLMFYYAGPLSVPIVSRGQIERMGEVAAEGLELGQGWRSWMIARGIAYTGLALLSFLFAEGLSSVWPWSIQPLELRVFTAQIAIVGWGGLVLLREDRQWLSHRLGALLVGAIGLLQLIGLAIGMTLYQWTLLGWILPIMFLEWVVTPLLLLRMQQHR